MPNPPITYPAELPEHARPMYERVHARLFSEPVDPTVRRRARRRALGRAAEVAVLLALGAAVAASLCGCGPEGPEDLDPRTGETGEPEACSTSALPHDWAEGLVDVYAHSCALEGTEITCCLALFVIPDHPAKLVLEAGDGAAVVWHEPPTWATAEGLEGELLGPKVGEILEGELRLDYCGLPPVPGFEDRSIDVVAVDLDLGVEAFEHITVELPSGVCQ